MVLYGANKMQSRVYQQSIGTLARQLESPSLQKKYFKCILKCAKMVVFIHQTLIV